MKFWTLALPAAALLAAADAPGGREDEAVEQAVMDYVDALYLVDPARIERSVHPSLSKVGFYRNAPDAAYQEARMTFEELRQLAADWNRSGRVDPDRAPKQVEVLDVLDQTATAKLTAQWGVDYLQLAKYDGRWQIVNVLWQTPPTNR